MRLENHLYHNPLNPLIPKLPSLVCFLFRNLKKNLIIRVNFSMSIELHSPRRPTGRHNGTRDKPWPSSCLRTCYTARISDPVRSPHIPRPSLQALDQGCPVPSCPGSQAPLEAHTALGSNALEPPFSLGTYSEPASAASQQPRHRPREKQRGRAGHFA